MDWRDEYFKNPRLHKVIVRLEKLGADINYVGWLAELVTRADGFENPRPIKRVTVQLPPWPALSAAAQLAKAQSAHEFNSNVDELRAQFERGQWYASDHITPGVRNSASKSTEADIHRLITDAYLKTAMNLAKKRKVDPAPDNIYDRKPKSPGSFALGTSNALSMLESRAAGTKSRRRQLHKHGRRSDIWGTFFLLALSEHLKSTAKNKQPNYPLCFDMLRVMRGDNKKSGASAKVRVRQFKTAHPEWQSVLDQAARDYNPPSVTETVVTAISEDPSEQIVAAIRKLVETGRLSASQLQEALNENTVSQLLESLAEQVKQS